MAQTTERSADRQATQQRDLLTGSALENSRSREDQLHQAYAADRARLLAGSYLWNRADDSQTYAQAITMVLAAYPRSIIEWATDPRTGIQGEEKHRNRPPNSGHVKAHCDAEMRRVRQSERPIYKKPSLDYVAPPVFPGCWARLFIPNDSPAYSRACEWASAPDRDERSWRMGERNGKSGIWVTLNGYDIKGRAAKVAAWRSPADDKMQESLMRLAGQERAQE